MSLGFSTPAFIAEETGGSTAPESHTIPARFAMKAIPGGENISIPYQWSAAPQGAKSFALTLVDTSPIAHDWVHWMVVGISSAATGVPEGASGTDRMPAGARELKNTFGFAGYGGPQPPAGTGVHLYVATLYALDVASPDVPDGATIEDFERAVAGHVVARQTCTGRLSR